jgi:hypothetical protein
LFWGPLFPGRAEAGAAAIGAAVDILACAELAAKITFLIYADKEYDEMVDEKAKDDARYAQDHAPLASQIFYDWSGGMAQVYSTLSAADALSFAAALDREMFDAVNPGYRTAADGSYVDFAQAYKDQAAEWQGYAFATVRGNSAELYENLSVQGTISQMKDAFMAAYGYRQLLQASAQTSNFTAQEVMQARLDTQRMLEAGMKYALDAWQEETDEEAAFEEGIKRWVNQSSGGVY